MAFLIGVYRRSSAAHTVLILAAGPKKTHILAADERRLTPIEIGFGAIARLAATLGEPGLVTSKRHTAGP